MQNELTGNSFPSLSHIFLCNRSRSLAKWVISVCSKQIHEKKSSPYNHSTHASEMVLNTRLIYAFGRLLFKQKFTITQTSNKIVWFVCRTARLFFLEKNECCMLISRTAFTATTKMANSVWCVRRDKMNITSKQCVDHHENVFIKRRYNKTKSLSARPNFGWFLKISHLIWVSHEYAFYLLN